ncbi:MAG: FtsX-like permease family protein, partial [Gemmatimonadaceae bacterium]
MRAWTRQRELVIRRALGASRTRLARHTLAECLLLAAIGGGLGLVVAWRGLHAIVALRPGDLADLDAMHIDMAALVWATAIALASGLLFGIAPALFSGAQPMGDALRAGVRSAVGSHASKRLRGGMIVAEVALSVVFLVATGLLVQSFIALERTSIG